MRRDEDHAAVAAEHDVAGHDHDLADAGRSVDRYERRVEVPVRIVQVMRRMVAAEERGESFDLFEPRDIAQRAVVDEAVAGPGVDRAADVVADRRAVLYQPELIRDINVTRLQHLDRP